MMRAVHRFTTSNVMFTFLNNLPVATFYQKKKKKNSRDAILGIGTRSEHSSGPVVIFNKVSSYKE